MEFGLNKKVAFVAASSKGLGKAVALALAKEGCLVIINGRNLETLNEAKVEIEREVGREIFAIQGDLSQLNERRALINKVIEQFGGVDILVTNTGGPPSGKFESLGDEDWENAYHLLLASAVGLIRGFVDHMKLKKWGRIIAITSVAVKQPVDNLILSNSVRASVVGLCKSLSNELGSFGITVNNVMPGYTNTERLQQLSAKNPSFSKVVNSIPLKRIGEPDEFAAAVSFLASNQASYITGVSLPVDGGASKGLL